MLQVYDAIPCQARFSYKCPPAPQISFAIPRQGAACLPSLDELLQLSAAAAAGKPPCSGSSNSSNCTGILPQVGEPEAAAAEGEAIFNQQQQQVPTSSLAEENTHAAAATAAAPGCCRPVMVAMPDGGDVNFYELRPVRLMDLLANQF
jgi:hypothetical protein